MKGELEFLRNEKVISCGGACTPSEAKRVRLDPPTAVNSVPTQSLIEGKESEMEDDSASGTKLKM